MKYCIAMWIVLTVTTIAIAFVFNEVLEIPMVSTAEALLGQAGIVAGLAVTLLLAVDVFFPVPSSLVMILSGVTFGGVLGGTLSFVGLMIGNGIGYELTRKYGPALSRRFVADQEFKRVESSFERFGPLVIIVTRPIPILMETLSLLAGLAGMKRMTFWSASAAGTLPVCFIYSFAGALSLHRGSLVPALLVGIFVPAVAWSVARLKLIPPESKVVDKPDVPH